eukprot:Skav220707  [mRNA]  locus=scaffold472:991006:991737:- [translate_table: standard]
MDCLSPDSSAEEKDVILEIEKHHGPAFSAMTSEVLQWLRRMWNGVVGFGLLGEAWPFGDMDHMWQLRDREDIAQMAHRSATWQVWWEDHPYPFGYVCAVVSSHFSKFQLVSAVVDAPSSPSSSSQGVSMISEFALDFYQQTTEPILVESEEDEVEEPPSKETLQHWKNVYGSDCELSQQHEDDSPRTKDMKKWQQAWVTNSAGSSNGGASTPLSLLQRAAVFEDRAAAVLPEPKETSKYLVMF